MITSRFGRLSGGLRRFSALAAALVMVTASSGCGWGRTVAQKNALEASATDASNASSCVDVSGPTIKIGFVNSLSGTMAISETTVNKSLHMAADEINAAGGVLGKQLKVVDQP